MNEIREVLIDVREKIKEGIYKNEEHIRLSLVARVIQGLGWDIWDPREVNSEFAVVPDEDQTRVDLALFKSPYEPSVYIEVKALGRIEGNLPQIERQLRDYNRNNTAQFCVITDGRKWRLYYAQTGGEFANKFFKELDILETDIEDLEVAFYAFLSKAEISSGNAKRDAESYLQASQKQRAMGDALPKARRTVLEPPFPSLPDALMMLLAEARYVIKREEAIKFIEQANAEDYLPSPQLTTLTAASAVDSSVTGNKRFPPDGTLCRFEYKRKTYKGRIANDMLVVEGWGNYRTWSESSVAITKTQRNGWRDWVIQLPGTSTWLLADDWRKKQR